MAQGRERDKGKVIVSVQIFGQRGFAAVSEIRRVTSFVVTP